jgi:limonene-1,2-epoxide hydrolase
VTDNPTGVADRANIDIIRTFHAAFSDFDVDYIMGFFTDDAVFHNIPIDPLRGKAAIRAWLAEFPPGVEMVEERILHILGDGPVVVTERVALLSHPSGTIVLPVMAIFELRDGLIAAWRDYFDLNQFTSQLPTPSE